MVLTKGEVFVVKYLHTTVSLEIKSYNNCYEPLILLSEVTLGNSLKST